MSMPEYPPVNPEITLNYALNSILLSIAMEELALSHIINAEGEELQYVLGKMESCPSHKPDVKDIVAVNQSVSHLLECVYMNQVMLKSKMARALDAIPKHQPCPKPDSCGCNAVFKGLHCGRTWCAGSDMPWRYGPPRGHCIVCPHDSSKITLCPGAVYTVSFNINVITACHHKDDISICLQSVSGGLRKDIFTFRQPAPHSGSVLTLSAGGIIVRVPDDCNLFSIALRLLTPGSLEVENSALYISELQHK